MLYFEFHLYWGFIPLNGNVWDRVCSTHGSEVSPLINSHTQISSDKTLVSHPGGGSGTSG